MKDTRIRWEGPTRKPPTTQQQAIVDATKRGGDHVCIAYAGSGKTGTGVEVAHALKLPGYLLVFGRAARFDAKPRLPANVQAITGHSLAFGYVIEPSEGYQRKLAGALDADEGPRLVPSTVAKALRLRGVSDPDIPEISQLALAILKTIEAFQISDADEVTPDHIPDSVLPFKLRGAGNYERSAGVRERITNYARKLWSLMINERSWVPIDHDTYLKIFQLRKLKLGAQVWILDEYQDTTPVVDAIVRIQPGQKLYLGDPAQQIFAWRGAVNAFDELIARGLPVHYLTDSFRFNHQIAGMATLILRALGESIPVRGQPRDLLQTDQLGPHTVICRSNLTILLRAAENLLRGRAVFIDGGLPEATRQRLKSALALYQGRLEDVSISILKDLGSWQALVEYTHEMGDRAGDTQMLINIVERYQDTLPQLLTALSKIPRRNPRLRDQITYITAHRAKGRQWHHVELAEDLTIGQDILQKIEDNAPLSTTERESLHVLYVALTRAELGIVLPPAIRKVFRHLHQLFAEPDDTTETFVATTIAPPDPAHQKAITKARTAEFIRRHRSS